MALPRALIAAALTVVAMGLLGLAFYAIGPWLVLPFSGDPSVIGLTAALLVLIAPFMWLDGVQLVCVYALRSLGDQVAAGVNGMLAFFVVTGGLGTLLVGQGLGARALIYAFVAGLAVAAVLQGARLLSLSRRLRAGPEGA